jgi:hypothetical protein
MHSLSDRRTMTQSRKLEWVPAKFTSLRVTGVFEIELRKSG